MENNTKKSTNEETAKEESNKNEIINIINVNPKKEKSSKVNSKKIKISSIDSDASSSILSNEENISNKDIKSILSSFKSNNLDNFVDNQERYDEVIEAIRAFERKANPEETPNNINQINMNKDIENLKYKLLNVKNDEYNLLDFINKIDELLANRKYEFNNKIFEKTVKELFFIKNMI